MTASELGKLDWALKYASLGIKVFPLARGAKVPREGSNGHLDATSDPETIRTWFARDPEMNWGAVGGAERINFESYAIERLVWVDLDIRPEKDGIKTLTDLCKAAEIDLADLNTLTIRTPSGGLHLGFFTDKPLRQGGNVLGSGSGVDLRNAEGYVLGPGSRIKGKAYEVAVDAPIASMGRLAELFPVGAPTKAADTTPLPGIDPGRAADRAMAYLKTVPTEGDPEAYPVACKLKDLGCTEEQAVELMQEYWDPFCDPPRTDDTATVVRNAFKYGREAPGISAPEAVFPLVPSSDEVPTPQRKRSLDLLRWADFKDRPIPDVRWVWGSFFPSIPFGVLASHPGHGKSILSLQITVAVATGLPLFGIPTCGPAGAGVLALEDDANVVHRRLKAIRESYGLAWTADHDDLLQANFVLMVRARGPESTCALELSKLARELGEAVRATKDAPAILFLDTLNAVHGGDENSNTETRELVAAIFGLHDSLNCSVWALHHLRKAGSGRNAPALTDRLDPELVRGAGALVGSARGVVQFGWVNPNEAVKAGLDPENSQRRYAVLGLTKVNDGPLSQWLLLEHTKPAGIWTPTVDGERALAILRGGNAKERLERAEAMLVDLHDHGGKDAGEIRSTLLARYFPDDPKASDKLKGALQDLRRRRGWLKPASLALTDEGTKEALRLKSRQSADDCLPDEHESLNQLDFA